MWQSNIKKRLPIAGTRVRDPLVITVRSPTNNYNMYTEGLVQICVGSVFATFVN